MKQAGTACRRSRRWSSVLATVTALALLLSVCGLTPSAGATSGGRAQARTPREIDLRPPPGMRSRSMRFAWDGKLVRGMRVPESEYIRYVGEYAKAGNFYGTWELVQLLERAARRVAFRSPGAKLSIGELSGASGGHIDGHRSHQSGRDVDLGFYVRLPDGSPHYTYAFANFDARGRGLPPNQYLRFDDERNWELVSKLLSDGDARVQYVFVASALRQRLLAEAARSGASVALLQRARVALVQPAHGHPHKNHFHVRIYCAPADQVQCHDQAPFWPWYPGTPPGGMFSAPGSPRPSDEP